MDSFVIFFRDTLDGPLYIVVVIVAVILLFACIGYLAEKSINRKKEAARYAEVSQDTVVIKPVDEASASATPNPTVVAVPPAMPEVPVTSQVVSQPEITPSVNPTTVPVTPTVSVPTPSVSAIPEVVPIPTETVAQTTANVPTDSSNVASTSTAEMPTSAQQNVVIPTIVPPVEGSTTGTDDHVDLS